MEQLRTITGKSVSLIFEVQELMYPAFSSALIIIYRDVRYLVTILVFSNKAAQIGCWILDVHLVTVII